MSVVSDSIRSTVLAQMVQKFFEVIKISRAMATSEMLALAVALNFCITVLTASRVITVNTVSLRLQFLASRISAIRVAAEPEFAPAAIRFHVFLKIVGPGKAVVTPWATAHS